MDMESASTERASKRLTVDVPKAAEMLGISRAYAFELARDGRLPGAIKLGNRIVVSREVIDRMLAGEVAP